MPRTHPSYIQGDQQWLSPTRQAWNGHLREAQTTAAVPNLMDFALHFPIRLIYSLIGFSESEPERVKQVAAWALAILAGPQVDSEKAAQARGAAMEAAKQLYGTVKESVVQVRASGATGGDLISRLIRAEFKGRQLDDHEITTFVRSLLPAAGETTTRTFGSLLVLLLERVCNDRVLVGKAIDDAARFESVATFKVRQAAQDLAIDGVKIPKGVTVQAIVMSDSRDEAAFQHADQFDSDRKLKPAFGFGPNMCIG
ncbi:MAG: hypothetical protein RLZZ401_160, partial [Pseudomonadota bacterium]